MENKTNLLPGSVQWIIQKNLIKPDVLDSFRQAFADLRIEHEEVLVIPFSNELPAFAPAQINIFYGSTTLMLNAYHHPDFRNGIFYDPVAFSMENYVQQWGRNMLNWDGQVLAFKDFIDGPMESRNEWFLRPNEDDKSFAGTIMTAIEIKEWYGNIQTIDNPNLNPDTQIFVCSPKQILKEWRNFVVNGRVVDGSRYMLNGRLKVSHQDCPEEMLEFVEKMTAKYAPHDIFVMDVAETSSGFKIIECNCFNGTGFYQHDLKKIIKAVNDWTREQ